MSARSSCVVGGDHLRPFVIPTFILQSEPRPEPRTSLVPSHTVCVSELMLEDKLNSWFP